MRFNTPLMKRETNETNETICDATFVVILSRGVFRLYSLFFLIEGENRKRTGLV